MYVVGQIFAPDTLFASISQQCFFLTPNQHQPPANSQSALFFSHNKSAPATNQGQPNKVITKKLKSELSMILYICV